MKNLNSPSLLITDGDCEFCQLSAAWLIKKFPGNWLNQPSQNSNLADLGLTKEEVTKQVWYLIPIQNTWEKYGGAKAIFKLLLQQPKIYIKPFAIFFLLPGPIHIAQAVYMWVTRNRAKLLWIFKR